MGKKDKKPVATGEEGDAAVEKKSGKGKFIIIGVVVAALAGGAYVVGSKSAAPAESESAVTEEPTTTTIELFDGCIAEPEHGAPEHIVDLPQLSINLADGHYLRAAVSLGLCADVILHEGEKFHSAPAQDVVVANLSGMDMAFLSTPEGRDEAKETLKKDITALYRGVVYEVFFVEFVMQ